jgi:hypothetical protein
VRWVEFTTRDGGALSELVDKRYLAVVLISTATLSACGSHSGRQAGPAPPTNSRVERCVDRLVAGSNVTSAAGTEMVRRYARDTYCSRFEQKGWVYEDGALKIAAQRWLQNGGTCAEGVAGQPAKVVPCKVERGTDGVLTIDCGLLRFVRRSEVTTYLRRLQAGGPVACEQGIPLPKLGVP